MRTFIILIVISFLFFLPTPVSAESGYISDITYSTSDKIYTLSESPSVKIQVTNPTGGSSYTARIAIDINGPDESFYTSHTADFSFNSGHTYHVSFNLENTLSSGVGFYETDIKLQKKTCLLFICWWDDVDENVDSNAYGVIFDRPNGFDNYLSDDYFHHPSEYFIRDYALSAITETADVPVLNLYPAMSFLQMWVHNYITYCSSPTYDSCYDTCDADGSYCGARSSDYWILYDKKGDCNDFADLYISLARSINIPSRVVSTMRFDVASEPKKQWFEDYSLPMSLTSGRFWWHALSESNNLNSWIHVDPTWDRINNPLVYKKSQNLQVVSRAWTKDYDNYRGGDAYSDILIPKNGWVDVTRERPYDNTWKPPELDLNDLIPKKVLVGNTYNVESWLENSGDITAFDVNLGISHSSGLELQHGDYSKKIEKLYSQSYNYSTWTFYVSKNGTLTLNLIANSTNAPSVSSQYYLISEYPVNFTPPNISTQIIVNENAVKDQLVMLKVRVYNSGDIQARCVSINLTLPNGLSLEEGENLTKNLNINPQIYSDVAWTVVANESGDYRERIIVQVFMDPSCNNAFENYENISTGFIVHSGNINVTIPKSDYKIGENIITSVNVENDGVLTENYSLSTWAYGKTTQEYMAGSGQFIENLAPSSNRIINFTFYPSSTWSPGEYLINTRLYVYGFWSVYSSYSSDIKNITILPSLNLSTYLEIPSSSIRGYDFLVSLNIRNLGNVEAKCVNNEVFLPDGLSLPKFEESIKTTNISVSGTEEIRWWISADKSGNYENQIRIETVVDPLCNVDTIDSINLNGSIIIDSGYLNLTTSSEVYSIGEQIEINSKITNDGRTMNSYMLETVIGCWETYNIVASYQRLVSDIVAESSREINVTISSNSTWIPGKYIVYSRLSDISTENIYDFDMKNITLLCTPNWIVDNNPCESNDTKLLIYIDANNCNKTDRLPENNGTYVFCDYCASNWTCLSYAECLPDDAQYCNSTLDLNDCYGQTNLSADMYYGNMSEFESQTCDYCAPDWILNESWSMCDDDIQFGKYYDGNKCYAQTNLTSDLEGKPVDVNRSCELVPPQVTINEPKAMNYSSMYLSLNVSTDETANCSYVLNGAAGAMLFTDSKNGALAVTTRIGANTIDVSCVDRYRNINDTVSVLFNVIKATYESNVDIIDTESSIVNASMLDILLEISTSGNFTNTSVNITKTLSNPTNASFGVTEIGKYIQIEAGADLLNNVTSALIKIFYTDEEIDGLDEISLAVYWYNESSLGWIKLDETMDWVYGTGVNATANYVWANVSHFSTYGVGGQKPNGESCFSASECAGGYCVHAVCRSSSTYCGDSYCDSGETCSTCNVDCGDCYSGGGSSSGTVVPPKDVNITFNESVDENRQIKTDIIPDTMDDIVRQGNPEDMQQGEVDKVKRPRVVRSVSNENETDSESNRLVTPTGAYLQSYSYPIFVVVAIAIILLVYLFSKSRKGADKYRNSRKNSKRIQLYK